MKVTDLNKYAISSKGVGEALLRSSAAMKAANNTLDETIALTAAANTVVQDPQKVGTTLRTVSMFLRAAKTEAEEAGESTEGMADSISELRGEILSLTGGKVDIQIDENNFKSTYQILKELSEVWKSLSDISQANITEKIGGKRNSNVVSALLENFSVAEKAIKASAESAGSALIENEKYLNSIQGKIDIFKASFEELSQNIIKGNFIKDIVKFATKLLSIINIVSSIDSQFVALRTILISVIATVIYAKKEFLKLKLAAVIDAPIALFKALKVVIISLLSPIKEAGRALLLLVGRFISIGEAAQMALPGIGLILAAITAITIAVAKSKNENKKSFDDLKGEYGELNNELEELNSELETTTNRINELTEAKKENGKLSIVEEDELSRLKSTNAELKYKIALNKQLLEQNQAESNKSFIELINKQGKKEGVFRAFASALGNSSRGGTDGVTAYETPGVESLYENEFEKADSYIAEYKARLKRLSELRAEARSDESDKEIARIEEENKEYLADIKGALQNLDKQLDGSSIVYIPHPTTDDQKAVNEYINLLDKLNDEMLLLAGENQVVFEGSLSRVRFSEASAALKGLEEQARLTTEELVDLYNSNTDAGKNFKEWVDYLNELGVITIDANGDGKLSADELSDALAILVERMNSVDEASDEAKDGINEVADAANKAKEAADELSNSLSGLVDKYELLSSAQKEIDENGGLSEATISKMLSAYPEMTQSVYEYLAGVRSGQELIQEMSKLYEDDTKAFRAQITEKFRYSTEFYDSLTDNQKTLIQNLFGSYDADFKNFTKIEDAKLAYQAAVIAKLAENYSKYANSNLEQLKAERDRLAKQISNTDERSLRGGARTYYETQLSALNDAIAEIESFDSRLNDIVTEPFTPVKYASSSNSSSSSKSVEKYTAEINKLYAAEEKLAAVQEKISDTEHQINMTDDTGEQIKLKQQLVALYQQEIAALKELNAQRDALISKNVTKLRNAGFNVSYDPKSDNLYISNQEHINDLKGKDVEATNELRKEYEQLIEDTIALNNTNKDAADNWQQLEESVRSTAEEVREMTYSDNLTDLKFNIEVAERNGSSPQQLIAKWEGVARRVESEIAYYTARGYDASSDKIQELTQDLWDAKDEIQSLIEELEQQIEDAFDDDLTDMKFNIEVSERNGASKEQLIAQWQQVIRRIEAEIAYYTAKGYDSTSDKIQELTKELWSANDEIKSIIEDANSATNDALDDILDKTKDLIRYETEQRIDAIEKQIDAYRKIIDLKKESLALSKEEDDYEKEVAEKVNDIANLQSRIDTLSLDDSREARAERAKLIEELKEKQEDLSDYQNDYAYNAKVDALDKELDAYEESRQGEIDALRDSISSEEKLYQAALARMNNSWSSLYSDLISYNVQAGNSINDDITESWNRASEAVQRYGSYAAAVAAATNGSAGSYTDDSVASLSAAVRENPLTYVGSYTASTPSTSTGNDYGIANFISTLLEETSRALTAAGGSVGIYHKGGVVGTLPAPKDNEVLSLLEEGEVVLDDKKKNALYKTIDIIDYISNKVGSGVDLSKLALSGLTNGLDGIHKNASLSQLPAQINNSKSSTLSFAPNITVSIDGSGVPAGQSAKAFGQKIADIALDKLQSAMGIKGVKSINSSMLMA